MGLLVTDIEHDYSVALIQRADQLDSKAANASFEHLKAQGEAALTREGIERREIAFVYQADMRYVGQSYELTIPVPDGELGPAAIADVLSRFHEEHERAFGFQADEEPVEFVALRLGAIGKIARPQMT